MPLSNTLNYYEFYFLILDYGIMKSFEDFERNLIDSIGYDDSKDDKEHIGYAYDEYFQRITSRDIFYPNTYGISGINIDKKLIIDAITSYQSFDSLQLRSKIMNTYGDKKKMKRVIRAIFNKLLFLIKSLFLVPYKIYNNHINKYYIKNVLSFNTWELKVLSKK